MKRISYTEYLHRETGFVHAPYAHEVDFFAVVARGDVAQTKKLCHEPFTKKEGLGVLSSNPMHNFKYHFAIAAALISRACISSGLPMAEAYTMSDYYIQLADKESTEDGINELHNEMALAYARKMMELEKRTVISRPIVICIDYIYEHLDSRITVDELASHVNLSPAYLSRIFKKETGHTISEYILSKKLETAKNMLAASNYSIADISASLAFPSQSHFSTSYKRAYGVTPLQQRKGIITN